MDYTSTPKPHSLPHPQPPHTHQIVHASRTSLEQERWDERSTFHEKRNSQHNTRENAAVRDILLRSPSIEIRAVPVDDWRVAIQPKPLDEDVLGCSVFKVRHSSRRHLEGFDQAAIEVHVGNLGQGPGFIQLVFFTFANSD